MMIATSGLHDSSLRIKNKKKYHFKQGYLITLFCPLGCRIPTNATPKQGECDTKVEQ